ncbi:MAG: Pr6Pr family membrane protein [Asticcacaulis sp.]|uniref:Pr6Pr family membrane protein n=1 Tax=Asticcacaulis sp. TaxID=1872648 RepID=UPI0039E6650D
MKKVARIIATWGLITGLAGLLLQFAITIPASMAAGRGFALSVLFYFSFFTIPANIGAVISHAAQVLPLDRLKTFHRRNISGAVTTMMLASGVMYHFVLAPLWASKGLFWLSDALLRYVTPILMLLWWLASANGKARFVTLLWWLVPPAAYMVFIYVRWLLVHEVPYPFLEPNQTRQDWLRGMVGLCEFYLLTAVVVVLADKTIGWVRREFL